MHIFQHPRTAEVNANRPPPRSHLFIVMSTPIRSDNQSLKDDSSSPSSPTPTIRNTTPVQPPSASQVFAAAVAASPGPAPGRAASQPGMNRRQSGQQQQQELGKGRPGKDDLVSEGDQEVLGEWYHGVSEFGAGTCVCAQTSLGRRTSDRFPLW